MDEYSNQMWIYLDLKSMTDTSYTYDHVFCKFHFIIHTYGQLKFPIYRCDMYFVTIFLVIWH